MINKNEFDGKQNFLRQFLVARGVRRTSITSFHKNEATFKEKRKNKVKDFTSKKEMDEASRKKANIEKVDKIIF